MKIAIVSSIYSPYSYGGAEISSELLARGLQRNGHEVVVLTAAVERHRSGKELIDGIPVYRIPSGLPYSVVDSAVQPKILKAFWHGIDLWNPTTYLRIKKILQDEKPEILHTNVIAGLSTSIWQASRQCGIPIVHTLRDYYLLCQRSNLITRSGQLCETRCTLCSTTGVWKGKMSRLPDAVVGISQFVLDKHREYGLFTGIPSEVIHNSIELPVDANTASDSRKIELPFKAIFLGRMELAKGPQVILDALTRTNDVQINLHMCGDGPLLNSFQEKYKNDSRIIFEGRVDGNRKRELLASSDVLIAPSIWYEPFNRTVIEAYGYGLPVIASRIGGLPELVKDGSTGFLFPPGDSKKLGEILRTIVSNPETLLPLKKQALLRAKDFNINDQVGQYEGVYNKLLHR